MDNELAAKVASMRDMAVIARLTFAFTEEHDALPTHECVDGNGNAVFDSATYRNFPCAHLSGGQFKSPARVLTEYAAEAFDACDIHDDGIHFSVTPEITYADFHLYAFLTVEIDAEYAEQFAAYVTQKYGVALVTTH